MSKDLSVKYMKAHLVFLNKQLRKELILSGVAKMKRNDIEKNFKDRFESTTNKKDGSIYYTPKNKYGDIEADEDDFKDLNNQLRPKKKEPKKEPKEKATPKPKEKPKKEITLKKLVSIAQSHKKNGISVDGLKAFFKLVQDFRKTEASKLEKQTAGLLYNYLNKIQMGKKRLPNNLNKALKQLSLKTF
tara:strand:+ start:108 stop:671 length:564 start_codon:yes stop_codon:yes gene_type:complete